MELLRTITEYLRQYYRISPIVSIEKIDRGFINDTYKVIGYLEGEKVRYCVRCYNKKMTERRIRFEHQLLTALADRGFPFSPRLLFSQKEKTWHRSRMGVKSDDAARRFLAVFQYIEGEDLYTWDHPYCTYSELTDCARTLAAYHQTIADWTAPFPSTEPTPLEKLSGMGGRLERLRQNASRDGSSFGRLLYRKMADVIRIIAALQGELDADQYQALPRLAVHGDFHPGNLRFENGRVKGMFDFDWAAMDARCLDLGMALMYFCTDWRKERNGRLMRDRLERFLAAYQHAVAGDAIPGPLITPEIRVISWMIRLGHLVMIDWAANEFYTEGGNAEEFFRCTRHCIHALEYMNQHASAIDEEIKRFSKIQRRRA